MWSIPVGRKEPFEIVVRIVGLSGEAFSGDQSQPGEFADTAEIGGDFRCRQARRRDGVRILTSGQQLHRNVAINHCQIVIVEGCNPNGERMSAPALLPKHLRPRREKVFGPARGIPLDRNAKARIKVYVQGYNARHKEPGQHHGPITRAYMDVFEALLWGFHNSRDGRCFPSYEAIADKAKCCRDTVYEAIKALEAADVLSWANRIVRELVRAQPATPITGTPSNVRIRPTCVLSSSGPEKAKSR
jgi:Helix-turn-helix domain